MKVLGQVHIADDSGGEDLKAKEQLKVRSVDVLLYVTCTNIASRMAGSKPTHLFEAANASTVGGRLLPLAVW